MCSSSPDAWNVPTIGPLKPISALRHGPGTAGSCRCTTSGSMLRITSAVRRAVARPGEIGATEPLEFHSTLGPTDTIAGLGRRAVARTDDAHVDAELAQLARQAEHLALHAAGTRERVRRRHHDPHARHRLSRTFRSLGQFGWSRCHCSGAARISDLELVARAPG